MAKKTSRASGPAGDPVGSWAPVRGGQENWAVFQIVDQHLGQLGLATGDRPPVDWPITQSQWTRWLGGAPMTRTDRDELASLLAAEYRRALAEPSRTQEVQFEGLAALSADLERAAGTEQQSVNGRFFELLAPHLRTLGWADSKRLALEWGYSESLLSGFRSGSRPIQVDHVNRLAVAMARGYDELPDDAPSDPAIPNAKERYGTRNLHLLLDVLLGAAGFSIFAGGREPNLVWKKLTRRESVQQRILRVGFFWWPPLTTASATGSVQGLARDLTELVANLMSVQIRWVPIRWPHVHTALATGEIDLIPPIFLRLPVRLIDLELSRPIPYLRCLPTGLLHADYLDRVLKPGATLRTMEGVDTKKIVWAVGRSEVTLLLARLLDPEADVDKAGQFSTIEEGWRFVLDHPFDDERGKVRVFPTEQLTAAFARERLAEQSRAATLLDPNESSEIGLGISFAAHSGEPRLIRMVDACIEEFSRRKTFLKRIFGNYRDVLDAARALPSKFWGDLDVVEADRREERR